MRIAPLCVTNSWNAWLTQKPALPKWLTQDPVSPAKEKQEPQTTLHIAFRGQVYDVEVWGDLSPALENIIRNKLILYAKFFGPDVLKYAHEAQNQFEPKLRFYMARDKKQFSEVLVKYLKYEQAEADKKANECSGIFHFENNAIVIQTDCGSLDYVVSHEIAHYIDDLLQPKTSAFDTDTLSEEHSQHFRAHYLQLKSNRKIGYIFYDFVSPYAATGDENKTTLFEWFAENIRFTVEHFESNVPVSVADTWIANDINSLALWTQGKGFKHIDQWKSLNPDPSFLVAQERWRNSLLFPSLDLQNNFDLPNPRKYLLPKVQLKDEYTLNLSDDLLQSLKYFDAQPIWFDFRLEPYHTIEFVDNCEPFDRDIGIRNPFGFVLPNRTQVIRDGLPLWVR